MIKDRRAWSRFAKELAEFEVIKGDYPNFKIMYVPRSGRWFLDCGVIVQWL